MKILYDHQMFDAQVYGGISRYFANLVSGFRKYDRMETEVSVLSTRNYYLKNNVKFRLKGFLKNYLLSKAKRLKSFNKNYSKICISRGQFDIFHPTYFHPYFLKFLRKPFVLTIHDMIYELFPGYFTSADLTAEYKRELVGAADHIIAISQTTKNDLIRLLNVPEEKITVVYHGYTPSGTSADPGLILPQRYILFVGSRDNYKNFERFAVAFSILKQTYPDIMLICVGGGEFTTKEFDYFVELGIAASLVQLNVNDNELFWIYKKAVAFVYPSLYEGFGLPILEAFEANCPVLASDIPCFREVAGEACRYFDPYDEESMASSLIDAVAKMDFSKSLILKGRKRLEHFSMEKCLAGTLEVYNKVY